MPEETLPDAAERVLRAFLDGSRFRDCGSVVTDLDGTAVHEREGRVYIPLPVEHGLQALHALGRPVVLNTMRFPLSVLRTFGAEWYDVTGQPIPAITLNGSLLGRVTRGADGAMAFEEIEAFPLTEAEIDAALVPLDALLAAGLDNLLLFFYPRDWRQGEVIWTPAAERKGHVAAKYRSASAVVSGTRDELRARLLAQPVCMIFLLVDEPRDRLMAYQHTRRENFFTRTGVDKTHGARAMARALGLCLPDSIGAGDAPPDTFLSAVGLAVHVGNGGLPYEGLRGTIKVPDAFALGKLLHRIADLHRVER